MLSASDTAPLEIEGTDKKKRNSATMPIADYFKGKGRKVMSDMQDRYGEKDGKSAFYATANKQDQNPEDSQAPKPKRKSIGQQLRERASR